ncbi:MAG: hypothetical protein HQL92_08480 [Magnetococcales bacterium]|nr:hypothetical protein [Magnetococcales bacterium]
MLSVTLPESMQEPLQTAVAATGGTIADLVAHAVERYLLELEEDRQDVEAARLALEEYEREGGGIPWEQLKQELGLE